MDSNKKTFLLNSPGARLVFLAFSLHLFGFCFSQSHPTAQPCPSLTLNKESCSGMSLSGYALSGYCCQSSDLSAETCAPSSTSVCCQVQCGLTCPSNCGYSIPYCDCQNQCIWSCPAGEECGTQVGYCCTNSSCVNFAGYSAPTASGTPSSTVALIVVGVVLGLSLVAATVFLTLRRMYALFLDGIMPAPLTGMTDDEFTYRRARRALMDTEAEVSVAPVEQNETPPESPKQPVTVEATAVVSANEVAVPPTPVYEQPGAAPAASVESSRSSSSSSKSSVPSEDLPTY